MSLLATCLSSCKKGPYACFEVLTPADSIRVGYPVRFNAECSGAAMYAWNLGNNKTPVYPTPYEAQTTYDSAGIYIVSVTVGWRNRHYGGVPTATKTIIVNP